MKKIFVNATVELMIFDMADIISTSGLGFESDPIESTTPESTPFIPDDGFFGEEIPLD